MSPLLRSLGLMALGILLLTANDATSKYLVQSHPIGHVVFFLLGKLIVFVFYYQNF